MVKAIIFGLIGAVLTVVFEVVIFWLLVITRKKIIELWKLTKKNTKTSLKG